MKKPRPPETNIVPFPPARSNAISSGAVWFRIATTLARRMPSPPFRVAHGHLILRCLRRGLATDPTTRMSASP